ncbi:hypothetical protein MRX96_000538 [Rhipicephalus microplus]
MLKGERNERKDSDCVYGGDRTYKWRPVRAALLLEENAALTAICLLAASASAARMRCVHSGRRAVLRLLSRERHDPRRRLVAAIQKQRPRRTDVLGSIPPKAVD